MANPPAFEIDPNTMYEVTFDTTRGTIVADLDPRLAPNTVNNFVVQARNGFYDGLTFHRVVPEFVIQGGDPEGSGRGGPGYKFADEPVKGEYTDGAVAMANSGDTIDMWGDGLQTRSFLYVDECLEGTTRLLRSDWEGPVNIGSDEMVTINGLLKTVADIAGKTININHIPGPVGVRGRNSDNRLIQEKLGWAPSQPLVKGLEKTYEWIERQVMRNAA